MPDALAGASEFHAHLFQSADLLAIEAVTHFNDALFARAEGIEQAHRLGACLGIEHQLVRRRSRFVAEGGREGKTLLAADRFVERSVAARGGFPALDGIDGHAQLLGQLGRLGIASEFRGHHGRDAPQFPDLRQGRRGQAHDARLGAKAAVHGLADPPRGVGAELGPAARTETVDRFDQSQVTFGNQVGQGHTSVGEFGGDFHDEPKVGFDHALARLGVAALHAAGERQLFLRAEERFASDLIEIVLEHAWGVLFGADGMTCPARTQTGSTHQAIAPPKRCHSFVTGGDAATQEESNRSSRRWTVHDYMPVNPWLDLSSSLAAINRSGR